MTTESIAGSRAGQGVAQSAGAAGTQTAPKQRDIRLDVFRGLALLLITVTHTGSNWLREFLPTQFGFSSGTEMFVFCSGIASGLAFGSVFVKRGFLMGTIRVVHRIWEIYWVHIASFVAVLVMTLLLAGWLGRPDYVTGLQQDVLLTHPRQALIGLVTLTYLPPLFDILPLYIVLLGMIPVVMAARKLSPLLPFVLVGGAYVYLWAAGGPDLPANPTNPAQHWLFNPFGWQLVFFTGFFIAMKWLPVPAPRTSWAVSASVLMVLFSIPLAWHVLYGNFALFAYLREAILPGVERSHFHILRFIHFIALAYLTISIVAAYPRLMTSPIAKVLAMAGRETLAVFIASVPIAVLGGTVIDLYGARVDTLVAVTVLQWAALIGTAYAVSFIKSKPWTGPAAPKQPVGSFPAQGKFGEAKTALVPVPVRATSR